MLIFKISVNGGFRRGYAVSELFVRDPQNTTLGQNIISKSVKMIDELGFEVVFQLLRCDVFARGSFENVFFAVGYF